MSQNNVDIAQVAVDPAQVDNRPLSKLSLRQLDIINCSD